jgi:methylmalonyl-CoA/ethylmalonyl-CoA epimerase
MSDEIFQFHHVGYAVPDIDRAVQAMEALGWRAEGGVCTDTDRKIRIVFCKKDGALTELIEPAAVDSPVSALLKKNGPTPYHLCYAVAAQNAGAARKILAEKGFALLLRDAPAPALQGRNVTFYYSKDLGLTEILWL